MERFKILRAALNPAIGQRLNDSYVFAWSICVYPTGLGNDAQQNLHRISTSRNLSDGPIRQKGFWIQMNSPTTTHLIV